MGRPVTDVTHEMRQRALGAVVGSAVGDALGAPFEFGPPGQYSARFPRPVVGGTGEMVGGGAFGWEPGEFTDDTQMALVQAESLIECGGPDPVDLFDRFRSWASGARDVGNQTRAVLGSDLVGSAAAAEHFSRHPGAAAGNGSLMRCVPTAVLCAVGGEDDSIEVARSTAAVTHGDPAAGWGTAIAHVIVRAAVRGTDPFTALDAILDRLPDDQHRFRSMLAPEWAPTAMNVTNGSVWGCLAQAVWAVRSTDSFADALIAAIDLGGDTDTVAAVTGGLAGAIHGVAAIPSRWATYVNGTVTGPGGPRRYRLADLQQLTARLLGTTIPPQQALPASLGPSEVVPGIWAANLSGAMSAPEDWGVVSLCRVGASLAAHPVRREFYLVDQAGDHNLDLAAVIDDAIATIDGFRAEGRQVLVHCYGGASRTGFVLRAWLMARRDLTDAEATALISGRWPHLSLWNRSFTQHLAERGRPAATGGERG